MQVGMDYNLHMNVGFEHVCFLFKFEFCVQKSKVFLQHFDCFVLGRISAVDLKSDKLQYNTLGSWVDRMIVSLTKRLMFQVLYFFYNFLQNYLQKSFQFIILFFHNFTKMKITSFECPKSNPATHCFLFNLSK